MAQAKAPTNAEKRIARPLTPEALAEYGELSAPAPTGDFDPRGAWNHTYRLWMTGGSWDNYRGFLTLERSPTEGDLFELEVRRAVVMPRVRSTHETTASIRCREDVLATPESWRLRSHIYDVKTNDEFAEGTVEQVGRFAGNRIEIETNGHRAATEAPAAWSSSWSLFEAVQRFPRTGMDALPFDLLDDLDSMKPGHRLICRGDEAVPFGGAETRVRRYDQIGQGRLPCRYYVDERGRLLLAHTELRAYILDPKALDLHEQKTKWIAGKEMK